MQPETRTDVEQVVSAEGTEDLRETSAVRDSDKALTPESDPLRSAGSGIGARLLIRVGRPMGLDASGHAVVVALADTSGKVVYPGWSVHLSPCMGR